MPGYLDTYGAGEEQREKVLKRIALALVIALVAGAVLVFVFYNWREERQARRFFELLGERHYRAAYAMWGCTEQTPCRDYGMPDFMKDWGTVTGGKVTRSRSCGSGVILTVDVPGRGEERLWVQRGDLTIGFSPYPGCPPGK
ncbi:MAG: hypothetical protein M1436_08600 [Acidobacteria bacterium]|nr:hypothetical protein [Acidobacteriota bacterium]